MAGEFDGGKTTVSLVVADGRRYARKEVVSS
jgi:hypothetical protein